VTVIEADFYHADQMLPQSDEQLVRPHTTRHHTSSSKRSDKDTYVYIHLYIHMLYIHIYIIYTYYAVCINLHTAFA
jgi:hypothetical protein